MTSLPTRSITRHEPEAPFLEISRQFKTARTERLRWCCIDRLNRHGLPDIEDWGPISLDVRLARLPGPEVVPGIVAVAIRL